MGRADTAPLLPIEAVGYFIPGEPVQIGPDGGVGLGHKLGDTAAGDAAHVLLIENEVEIAVL